MLAISSVPTLPTLNFSEWILDKNGVALCSPQYSSPDDVQSIQDQLKRDYPLLKFTVSLVKQSPDTVFSIHQHSINFYCYKNYPSLIRRVVELWGDRFILPPDDLPIIENIQEHNTRLKDYSQADLEAKFTRTFTAAQQTLNQTPNPYWDFLNGDNEEDEDSFRVVEFFNRNIQRFILNNYQALSPKVGIRPLEAGAITTDGRRPYQEDRMDFGVLKIDEHIVPYFAVFDGHSGSFTSDCLKNMLKRHLTDILTNFMLLPNCFETELKLYSTLKLFFLLQGRIIEQIKPTDRSGSTALLSFILDNHLWVVNVGDSRAILCHNGQATALTIDAALKTEKQQRSVWKRGQNIFSTRTTRRVLDLNMSRAIKHHEETSGINPRAQVLKIDLDTLKDERNYLVLATDGLFDVATSEQVARFVDEMAECNESSGDIAYELVIKAFEAESHDNISAIVVKLDALQNDQS